MSSGYVCPECGLEYESIAPSDAVVALRSYPRRYAEALHQAIEDRGEESVRKRPEPATWSALEYTAHVADLMPAFADFFRRMAVETGPTFTDFWDVDERAASQGYNEMSVHDVLSSLATSCEAAAAAVAEVPSDGWTRTGTFPWGDRDLLTMVRNAVHEGVHHLRDAEKGLAATT